MKKRLEALANACRTADRDLKAASKAEMRARQKRMKARESYLKAASRKIAAHLESLEWKFTYADRNSVRAIVRRSHELAKLLRPAPCHSVMVRVKPGVKLTLWLTDFANGDVHISINKDSARVLGWYAPQAVITRHSWARIRSLIKTGALKTEEGLARIRAEADGLARKGK